MKLLGIIPARLGAVRLPRKPLRLVGGEPLIVRVWQRANEIRVVDRCVVATDSTEVRDAVRAAGGEAVLTRDDHASGTDRIAEVAAHPEFAQYECIVNIQGDEPFTSAAVVDAAARLVSSGRFALGTVACTAVHSVLAQPDVVKVVTADDGRALYFSRAAIPHLRDDRDDADRAHRDTLIRRHIGIYAYTRDALARWVALPAHPLERVERLEQLRPLANGLVMGVATVDLAPPAGIDTEADLARANAEWSAWYEDRKRFDFTVRPAHDAPHRSPNAAA